MELIKRKMLREQMAQKRASLLPVQAEEYSQQIIEKLWALNPIVNARAVMVFASMGNEVNLDILIKDWVNRGNTILLPRVEPGRRLVAVEFKGWQHTQCSAFGIREPQGEAVDPADIDVVIVPGLVFDGRGYRLGYGKGYYDRFLKLLTADTFKCGVCYDFQVIDDISPHVNDVPVHWIVTEKSELAVDWDFF